MDEHFLDKLMHEMDPSAKRGSHVGQEVPWYNSYGDCIQFQTVNEAIVARRVDKYLTLYFSAVSNEPIGFQIKDVLQLIQKYGCAGINVKREVQGHRLVKVSWLLLYALSTDQPKVNRVEGYDTAIEVLSKGRDVTREHVEIPQ